MTIKSSIVFTLLLAAAAPLAAQDHEARARRAYTRCGQGAFEAPPVVAGEDRDWAAVSFDRRGAGWRVAYTEWGQGTEATHGGFVELFEPAGCRQLRYTWSSYDGAMRSEGVIRWRNRGAPSDIELADVAAERGRSEQASHAFAQMWLSQRCGDHPPPSAEGPWDLEGPIAPPQPWFDGRPNTPVPTFWPEAAGADVLRGVHVPALGAPRRVRTAGAIEIWAADRDDRNGAQALALYDPHSDRHRWVTVTRGCVNGTDVEWIAEGDGVAVGVTSSRHGVYAARDAVLVLDLERGVALRLRAEAGIPRGEDYPWRPITVVELARLAVRTARGPLSLTLPALAARARERAARPVWSADED